MNQGKIILGSFLILTALFVILYGISEISHHQKMIGVVAGKAVIQSTGISTLAINSPGLAARNIHAGWGIYSILSDIPGGYSCFSDDEKLDPPPGLNETIYQIEIRRVDR